MATVNATLSNFFGIAELSYRGIGSGETRSHPSLPSFMQNVGKIQGVNYAASYSEAIMGKGNLTNVVNDYSDEKSSFKSEFQNAMNNAKKTAGRLNSLDYGVQKNSPQGMLNRNAGAHYLNQDNDSTKVSANKTKNIKADIDESKAAQVAEREEDNEANDEKLTELANESRKTPPFQAQISDNAVSNVSTINTNMSKDEISSNVTDVAAVDPSKTAGAVSNLMEDYNDTVGFLQSRIGTSDTFDHFASSFGNSPELVEDMDKIGVQVEPATGMVSVDTKTLTEAIKDSPDSVENILGKNGLGGAIEKSSEAGNFSSDKMFPSITDTLGGRYDNLKGMYGQMRQVTATPRGNLGNLMDTNY